MINDGNCEKCDLHAGDCKCPYGVASLNQSDSDESIWIPPYNCESCGYGYTYGPPEPCSHCGGQLKSSAKGSSSGLKHDAIERLLSCAIDLRTHILKQQACHSMLVNPGSLLIDTQEAIDDVKALLSTSRLNSCL